ncbi:MAG TPA: DICT sensory domain-containing protein [Microthrixaceae bacterium]|nr:DICT sensory domain-containing protein [Microthrixaceae bacterium]
MNDASLTIGDLAERTGVAVATLRAWEARFGFPQPRRLASGHRRYPESDVAAIEQVLRARDRGLSLAAAIAGVQDAERHRPPSIFGALRQRHQELVTHRMNKTSMLAVSRAIEDEWMSTSGRGLVIGSFQRVDFYRRSARRWKELARTADHVVVLADFPKRRVRRGEPIEVPLPADAPLLREWAIVADGPHLSAMVAGWEHHPPSSTRRGRDHHRRFEVVWSADPVVVRTATEAALDQAQELGIAQVDALRDALPGVIDAPAVLDRAMSLANRIVGYLADTRSE